MYIPVGSIAIYALPTMCYDIMLRQGPLRHVRNPPRAGWTTSTRTGSGRDRVKVSKAVAFLKGKRGTQTLKKVGRLYKRL